MSPKQIVVATILFALCLARDVGAATRVTIEEGKWRIDGEVTYPGAKAEGLLMNVRMVNSTFEDRNKPEFDANANAANFLKQIPDYAAHAVRAFTLCLQGGMPGYEGAVNSAFNGDGSLRADYLKRVERVIRACDEQGLAVILGCYYQRQDQILRDEQAVRTGVLNVVEWITKRGYRNVVLEIANEFDHSGFDHAILRTPQGEVELIKLAKQRAPQLLVSTSGLGHGRMDENVARAADFILIHFNGTPLDKIPERIAALKKFNKPIVVNEDDKIGETAARAAELSVENGASWGLMLNELNQYVPFEFKGAADDPVVYAKLKELTTPAGSKQRAGLAPEEAALFLDFEGDQLGLRFYHGAKRASGKFGGALEFTSALQHAEIDFSRKLDRIDAMSIGGWFFPRRSGEQCFVFRGAPEIGPLGDRLFKPAADWVNFVLGTDQRGFFMGTINGNGSMPFVHVTISEIAFDAWNQLVVVKDAEGVHKFYHNGELVHSDKKAASGAKHHSFQDAAAGEPVRLAAVQGGLIGEAWVYRREISADEIRADFLAKKGKYNPAFPGRRVALREMNMHARSGLWSEPLTAETWPVQRTKIEKAALEVMGEFPTERVPLEPKTHSEKDCGDYLRQKVSIQVQANDRMPAWMLIPKNRSGPVPAIICFYGTTSGAGKNTTVGLSGRVPSSPPHENYSFAMDMVRAGFVAFAPDYLRDGERVAPGARPYDTTAFYERFPAWSIHGKDAWDTSRAVDYLQTLDFVDAEKVGMIGHSYGGHSTIFTAAFEPRIKVAVANGPVSDFLHHGMHWAVPKGAGNSQSMPALRPYVLDHTLPLPITFYQFTALLAPRPLLVGQAAGERRPMEEENYAAVHQVYRALGCSERVRYHWYPGDHDFPPEARRAAVEWFKQWFAVNARH